MYKKRFRLISIWICLGILGFLLAVGCTLENSRNVSTSADSQSKECRHVQHAMGIACIPFIPKRIVTLSTLTLENALLLGVKPVGSTHVYEHTRKFLHDNNITFLGRFEPELETLTRLKPDLIIGWGRHRESIYPLLSQIAPTIIGEWTSPLDWSQHFDLVAQVLNKEREAEEAWESYHQKVTSLKLALASHYQDQTISFIHIHSVDRGIESDVKNSFAGSVLDAVGLQRPTAQNIEAPYGIISISEEELEKVDGDILFVTTFDRGDQVFEEIKREPLWKNLSAVQGNRVYLVDAAIWTGGSLSAANALLDDLFKYLVNTP